MRYRTIRTRVLLAGGLAAVAGALACAQDPGQGAPGDATVARAPAQSKRASLSRRGCSGQRRRVMPAATSTTATDAAPAQRNQRLRQPSAWARKGATTMASAIPPGM